MATATASQTAYGTSASAVVDGITTSTYKSFAMQENILDGTYHPVSGTAAWWSVDLSGPNGYMGKALTINSAADYFIAPSSTDFSGLTAISYEVSVRWNGTRNSVGMTLFNKGITANGHRINVTNVVGETTHTVSARHTGTYYTAVIPDMGTDWHHFAYTFDGTILKVYYDGELIINANTGLVAVSYLTQRLTIGSFMATSGTTPIQSWLGGITEFRIWKVLLTQERIRANMYRSMIGSSDLLRYYRMNTTPLTGILPDSSSYAIDGTTSTPAETEGPTGPTITVSDSRSMWGVEIFGDDSLGEWPTRISIGVYNGTTLLYGVSLDNDAVHLVHVFPTVLEVTSIVYTFSSVNKANRSVKIVEAMASNLRTRGVELKPQAVAATLNLPIKVSQKELVVTSPIINKHIDVQAFIQRNLKVQTPARIIELDNIYTAMDKDERAIFGRVDITYTDPFLDEEVEYTVSEQGRYTYANQLSDNIITSAYKWFSLHDNKLDGSYHPMPDNQQYSVGWWGTSISDVNGYMPAPVTVSVKFSSRPLSNLRLSGDLTLGTYPVDFVITAFNSVGTLLGTYPVTGNTESEWLLPITQIADVVRITLSITRINKPFQPAKLTELFTSVKETYLDNQIVSINILEEAGYSTGSLPIGNISANEVDVTLWNEDRRFDLTNTNSPLHGLVKRNRRVEIFFGAYVNEVLTWQPMGTFWVNNWDIGKSDITTRLTARDRLELLRLSPFTSSILYINKTLYELFETILVDAGLFADEYELDSELHSITIPYAWFGIMSHREALARLAGCGIIQVYCTKRNRIKVNLNLDATSSAFVKFDDDVNVFGTKFPLAVSEQINRVEVTAKPLVVTTNPVELLNDKEVFKIPANSFLVRTYAFSRIPIVSVSTFEFTADTGVTVIGSNLRAWGIEVLYTNPTGTELEVRGIKITGKILEGEGAQVVSIQNDTLIKEDGMIKSELNHDFIQTRTYAQALATTIMQTYSDARYDATLANTGSIALRLGDRVLVEASDNTFAPYTVTRQQYEWSGALSATTEAKKL